MEGAKKDKTSVRVESKMSVSGQGPEKRREVEEPGLQHSQKQYQPPFLSLLLML